MSPKASYVPRRSPDSLRHLDVRCFFGGPHGHRLIFAVALVLLAILLNGCAVMINKAGEALVSGNSVYATDDDPDLVWEAVPFGLKTIEGLLVQAPKNQKLLLAASSGFTQYGYGHLQQDADFIEAKDLAAATALRTRARKMYRRALDYGFRGLEIDVPNFRAQLQNAALLGALGSTLRELAEDVGELIAQEYRDYRGRGLVRAQPVVVARRSNGRS